ncbi:Aryl-alcohol dehydrogenase [Fulvia fulva]|uniref:Aryl-alcohol dehydrogenase n=1 Tax=Passalora fulva TaxID=5499 RepID=A0A9Q8UWT3_PASFU|nr:Aryl-alcohol dehydrogenase [Fulvia fulva]KAK4609346.1 Aryl-alcohol dehydrogenase [Fulvia fulva]UJO25343.1 Aryl-alcohol dehydrogenase [Fulvia fulva]WPV22916.1 Aryl-alcohol dehydrogenase [Fulvia fulva]WPV37719.1 Aryl-alcohol dehydrogenase [Fulvia fulva]
MAARPLRSATAIEQYASMTSSQAIVASEPGPEHHGGDNWEMTDIRVPTELKDGEILVEMVASGICHTDIALTNPHMGQTFPMVAGHEGSGYVKAVGPNVTKPVKPGDPVLLSFDSCSNCKECHSKRPAYCDTFAPMNLFGESDVFKGSAETQSIGAKFFGHSSFAKLSIVKETTVLPVTGLIKNDDELKLFAPLGCGIQTGAGAILNLTKPGPDDIVMVCGLGGVGLSAVMGAHIAGCKQIIAVDKNQARIDIAIAQFGATHGLNTSGLEDLTAAMKHIAGGRGPNIVVETTGFPLVLESAYYATDTRGAYVQVGGPTKPDYRFALDLVQHLFRGVKLWGCVEGDSFPGEFIPQLIQYYREGKLPVDKMVKYYDAKDFKKALHDMHAGETIKPVLVW